MHNRKKDPPKKKLRGRTINLNSAFMQNVVYIRRTNVTFMYVQNVFVRIHNLDKLIPVGVVVKIVVKGV